MLTPHLVTQFSGIYGSVNPLVAPEGSAEISDNTVSRSLHVLEPRRGYTALASPGAVSNALTYKEGKLVSLTWDNAGTGVTGALRYYDPVAVAWVNLPMTPGALPFAQPLGDSTVRTRFASAQRALYFQSRYGLTKVEGIAGAVSRPVVRVSLPINNQVAYTEITTQVRNGGTVNWLANNFQTAYRFTIFRKGANGERIESDPTERVIVSNTSGSAGYVAITPRASHLLTSDSSIAVYRSILQSAVGTIPTDEMFLVAELSVASLVSDNGIDANGFISISFGAPSFTYNDFSGDNTLSVPLYSNLSSGTAPGRFFIAPPSSVDVFYLNNRMYYPNTSDIQRFLFRVIGTGTGGLQVGDSITINGTKLTFSAEGSQPLLGFTPITTSGTVTQNIENTARQLASAINGNNIFVPNSVTINTALAGIVEARYISTGLNGDFGLIQLQTLMPGVSAISIKTSSRNGWASDYTAGVTSDPSAQQAGVSWSEFSQPEAVPLSNSAQVGDASDPLYRGIALRTTGFLFKKADGCWKLTDDGSTVGPQITLFDPTVKLIAPDTAVAIDNSVIGLFDQGMLSINEMGKESISHQQIERELNKLVNYVGQSVVSQLAFAVAQEREHLYLLAMPESPLATSCTAIYVYNTVTRAWTRWKFRLGVTAGTVDPSTGKLVWAMSDGTIWVERKNGDSSDYQDPGFTITSPATTITATMVFAGDLRTVSGGATPIDVGDMIQQAQGTNFLQQRVTAVSYNSGANQTTITLDAAPRYAWTASNLTVVKAIQSVVKFLPFHATQPLVDKQWGDAFLAFKYIDADFMQIGFSSEKCQLVMNTEQVVGSDTTTAKGSIPAQSWAPTTFAQTGAQAPFWGRRTRDVVLKATIPQDCSPAAQLTMQLAIGNALARWELSAIDVKIARATTNPVR